MHYLSNVLTIPNGYLIVSLKIFKTLDLAFLALWRYKMRLFTLL